jgi:hypothetical protein
MPPRAITTFRDNGRRVGRVQDIPLLVNWNEAPTFIAFALGLSIQLPNFEEDDLAYWETFDRDHWRMSLIGKVDMTEKELTRDNPDWVRLKRLGGTIEAWFELEQGIVFDCRAAAVGRTTRIIRQLAETHRLRLWREGEPLITASHTVAGPDAPGFVDLSEFLEPAGFEWRRRHWVLKAGAR